MIQYRINYRSTHGKTLSVYLYFLKNLFKTLRFSVSFISLPKILNRITLLKSPHVYKKAKEQFEVVFYSCAVELILPRKLQLNILRLLYLNKPHAVSLKVVSTFR